MISNFTVLGAKSGGGLTQIAETLTTSWLGPIFLLAMAVIAIKLFFGQKIREMIMVVVLGCIAAVLIFLAPMFFGSNGKFTKSTGKLAEQIGMVAPYEVVPNDDGLQ